jgi:ubiquinone biosynthesis protein UbiJ
VFPHSLVGIGQKERRSHGDQQDQQDQQDTKVAPQVTQALARLDGLVRTISGTLTQEISPRLGHDPFRLLGEDLAEEEQVHYPEKMLHVAYDRILQKDEEIQRLQNEVNRLLGEREQHAEKLL